MKYDITSEKQNLLFDRKEVVATVVSEATPRKADVVEELAKKYKVDGNAILIKKVGTSFGSQKFPVKAHIYKTKEERDKVEFRSKKEIENEKKAEEARLAAEEEAKKAAEAPAEEPKEEAPAETPAEEKSEGPEKTEEKAE